MSSNNGQLLQKTRARHEELRTAYQLNLVVITGCEIERERKTDALLELAMRQRDVPQRFSFR